MSQFCRFLLEFSPSAPKTGLCDSHHPLLTCLYDQTRRSWKQTLCLVYHHPSSPCSLLPQHLAQCLAYCSCSVHICHMNGQKGLRVLRGQICSSKDTTWCPWFWNGSSLSHQLINISGIPEILWILVTQCGLGTSSTGITWKCKIWVLNLEFLD